MTQGPQVFLSYAREDRAKAEQIYDSLSKEGFRPWMDSQDILPGQSWKEEIDKALKSSNIVLAFISRNSISKRGYIQVELKAALSLLSMRPIEDIFLIPVRIEDCPFPESLAHLHSVDLFDKEGWTKLLKALNYVIRDEKAIGEFKDAIKIGVESEESKGHIFVAMPFDVDMEDIYHYGIQSAVHANGFTCERVDLSSFTGSILQQIRKRVETSVAVIADLTGGNPNVHLELGYAWGKDIPTILIVQNIKELSFDVRDQRCIEYRRINALENSLTQELARLKSKGDI